MLKRQTIINLSVIFGSLGLVLGMALYQSRTSTKETPAVQALVQAPKAEPSLPTQTPRAQPSSLPVAASEIENMVKLGSELTRRAAVAKRLEGQRDEQKLAAESKVQKVLAPLTAQLEDNARQSRAAFAEYAAIVKHIADEKGLDPSCYWPLADEAKRKACGRNAWGVRGDGQIDKP